LKVLTGAATTGLVLNGTNVVGVDPPYSPLSK
jgi:hypothetical protein